MAGFETIVMLKDEAATAELGARIAKGLKAGDAVALSGELGAGKTMLARAILRTLGVEERVPSPTFTLVQAYETPALTVHHFDLYRIEYPTEMAELGLEDALEEGAALIEWPERGLPAGIEETALRITLDAIGETTRQARIAGPSRWRHVVSAEVP